MKTGHPSEKELQAYATGDPIINAAYSLHIGTCDYCQAEVAAYRFVDAEIQQVEKPAFEFDLSALVVAQLPVRSAIVNKRSDYWLILIGIASILIGLYVYQTEVFGLFAGSSRLIVFTTCALAISMLTFGIWEHSQKYHRQLMALGELNTLQP